MAEASEELCPDTLRQTETSASDAIPASSSSSYAYDHAEAWNTLNMLRSSPCSKQEAFAVLLQVLRSLRIQERPCSPALFLALTQELEQYYWPHTENKPFRQLVLDVVYPALLNLYRSFCTVTRPETEQCEVLCDVALIRLVCSCGYPQFAKKISGQLRADMYTVGKARFPYRAHLYQELHLWATVHQKTYFETLSFEDTPAEEIRAAKKTHKEIEQSVGKWATEDGMENMVNISTGRSSSTVTTQGHVVNRAQVVKTRRPRMSRRLEVIWEEDEEQEEDE
ncbi:unnamed protein product [Amoebophrya sp. A120]|nr:unnamed protein product [Amoebophrya sp. A120]|eukprot:GSA120T00001367001.1